MKVVIFAGGLGTRLSEETAIKPKPMVEIGDMPVLWHIMKIYSSHGLNDFVICLGYKGHVIKEFFQNYMMRLSSVRMTFQDNRIEYLDAVDNPWTVTLVDTGELSMTGGRLKRVAPYLDDEPFCLTYGDGVANIDIRALLAFHKAEKSLCTLTAVQPPGRFGAIALGANQTKITQFQEKPEGDGAWINGGYFVCQPEVLDFIDGDDTIWEREPLTELAHSNELSAYKHAGFWHPMDTLHDKQQLESLWRLGQPPWKIW